MRLQNEFASVLHSEAPSDVIETSSHCQRRRRENRAFELGPQALPQDRTDIDRCGLKKDMLSAVKLVPGRLCRVISARRTELASAFDPEHSIAIFRFEGEPKLYLYLLRAADEIEHLLRLLLQRLKFTS